MTPPSLDDRLAPLCAAAGEVVLALLADLPHADREALQAAAARWAATVNVVVQVGSSGFTVVAYALYEGDGVHRKLGEWSWNPSATGGPLH